jgi:hypothetical protein
MWACNLRQATMSSDLRRKMLMVMMLLLGSWAPQQQRQTLSRAEWVVLVESM